MGYIQGAIKTHGPVVHSAAVKESRNAYTVPGFKMFVKKGARNRSNEKIISLFIGKHLQKLAVRMEKDIQSKISASSR